MQKLKNELKSRDLDTTGKKAELAERLEAHLQSQPEPTAQANGDSTAHPAAAAAGSSAPVTGKVSTTLVHPYTLVVIGQTASASVYPHTCRQDSP